MCCRGTHSYALPQLHTRSSMHFDLLKPSLHKEEPMSRKMGFAPAVGSKALLLLLSPYTLDRAIDSVHQS